MRPARVAEAPGSSVSESESVWLGVVAASFPGSAREPPQEGSDWLVVGRVAVAAPGTLQQAAQHQKPLILEHATKISQRLRV